MSISVTRASSVRTAAIEKAAKDLEPEFWEVSKAEHVKRVAELKERGLNLVPAAGCKVNSMKDDWLRVLPS